MVIKLHLIMTSKDITTRMHTGIMVVTITIRITMDLMAEFTTGMGTIGMRGDLTMMALGIGLIILHMATKSQMDTITGMSHQETHTIMKEFITATLVVMTDIHTQVFLNQDTLILMQVPILLAPLGIITIVIVIQIQIAIIQRITMLEEQVG